MKRLPPFEMILDSAFVPSFLSSHDVRDGIIIAFYRVVDHKRVRKNNRNWTRKPRGNVEMRVNDVGQISKVLRNEDERCE